MIIASQAVGAIPRGVKWTEVPAAILAQLAPVLPTLPGGRHTLTVRGAKWTLDLNISKTRTAPHDPGKFFTARVYPGDPGPELIIAALERKIPKLAAAAADTKILLLEKDAAAGTIEAQFEQLPDEPRIHALLNSIDQIWAINSAALEREDVIFTNQVYPPLYDHENYCSLELGSDKFWQES